MSEKPISPLRQRMIEDMSVRNFGEKTRNDYIRHVGTFTAFLGRAPDTATAEDLRRFQLHQTKTGVHPPTINGSVAALRFFFTVTLGRANVARHLTLVREPRKLPLVLSLNEIARLLEAAPGPNYKAALSAARPRATRRAKAVSSPCRCRCRRSRAARELTCLSVLPRPHGHHRDLRPRHDPAPSANGTCDQDRYLMSAATVSPAGACLPIISRPPRYSAEQSASIVCNAPPSAPAYVMRHQTKPSRLRQQA
jgi:hypothetical protein